MKLHPGIKTYLRRLLVFLGVLTFLRLAFLVQNKSSFSQAGFADILQSFFGGIYFDFIYAFYALLPIMLLLVFGSYLLQWKVFRWVESIYFIAIVLVSTVLACIDAAYFPFVKSHLGADLLFFVDGENNISLWSYIFSYWPLLILCLGIPPLAWYLSGKFSPKLTGYKWYWVLARFVLLIGFVLIVRGGFRLRPITSLDAVLFAPPNMEALVANPQFVFVESISNGTELQLDLNRNIEQIQESNRKYFGSSDSVNSVQWQNKTYALPSKPNFVIIILESFGKEFTGANTAEKPSYTPFLDSLATRSFTFNRCYANGQKSKDAIPAIFTGIPGLVENGFITSKYSKNELPSVLEILEKEGYTSHFFHGANNGSMGFRNYLLSHGLDSYFGIDEYPEYDRDFDGNWGIFDEPYLKHFGEHLGGLEQPFIGSVFTLSSHDPYVIPDKYKDALPSGVIRLHKSIGYTDLALRNFFKSIEDKGWAENTIFIITADHSSLNSDYRYEMGTGKYEIPLMFYSPKFDLTASSNKPVQHIDILPSILDIINYDRDSVVILGESVFSTRTSPLVFKDGGAYYITDGTWELKSVNNQAINLHNLMKDPRRLENVLSDNQEVAERLLEQLKDVRANYAQKLILNSFE